MSKNPLIDTHAHLYDEKYKEEIKNVIKRAEEANIEAIYMPNLNSETVAPMCALQRQYPHILYSMMGLHPCDVRSDYQDQLNFLQQYLTPPHSFVAIGEIGLDYYHSTRYREEQIKVLNIQLEWANQKKMPAVLHARNSLEEVIEQVALSKLQRGIFHCFTGTLSQAKKIIKLGFHLGIGGISTFPKSFLTPVIREIPLEYMVLETDAPWLAPQIHRGKRNEPSYLIYIAQKIAEIKEISTQEVIQITTASARRIFQNF